MKKLFTFALISFAILGVLFFGKTLFAIGGATICAAPLVSLGKEEIQSLTNAVVDAMKKENPTGIGHYLGDSNKGVYFHDGGVKSFVNEKDSNAEMVIVLTNATAAIKRIVLCPAYFKTLGITTTTITIGEVDYDVCIGLNYHDITALNAYGLAIHGVIDDDTLLTDTGKTLTCESQSSGTVNNFLEYIKKNPSRVVQMTIESNNVDQYKRKIWYKPVNPTTDTAGKEIQLSKFFDVNQERDEKIIVNTEKYDLTFSDQHLVYIEIAAAIDSTHPTVSEITMTLGASINDANELIEIADTAKNIIATAGINK